MAKYWVYGSIPFCIKVDASNEFEAIDRAESHREDIMASVVMSSSSGEKNQDIRVNDIQFDDYEIAP